MRIRPAPASAERDWLPTSNRAQSCVQKIPVADVSPIAPETNGGEHLLPTIPIALLQVRIGPPERVWRRKVVSEEHQVRPYTPSRFDQKRRNARLHLGKARVGFMSACQQGVKHRFPTELVKARVGLADVAGIPFRATHSPFLKRTNATNLTAVWSALCILARTNRSGLSIGCWSHGAILCLWYSWVGSNHRPPVPQTGALTN